MSHPRKATTLELMMAWQKEVEIARVRGKFSDGDRRAARRFFEDKENALTYGLGMRQFLWLVKSGKTQEAIKQYDMLSERAKILDAIRKIVDIET